MSSLTRRVRLRLLLPFLFLFLGTERVAHQDLASLLLKDTGVLERARSFLLSNPFARLRTATFSLPAPLGAAIPKLPIPNHFEVLARPGRQTASVAHAPETEPEPVQTVDRSRKADRLALPEIVVAPVPTQPASANAEQATGIPRAAELPPARVDMAGTLVRGMEAVPSAGMLGRTSLLFFGSDPVELPPLAFHHRPRSPAETLMLAALPGLSLDDGSSVAEKGVVTGDSATLKSPAERLGLAGQARAKAEKCLADAIYFESRGEPERGQIAVAQVVINRVFSGYYPGDVCETVYQNAHRYLACQFTFACEGKKLVVNDSHSWERATRISRDMLDGKLWLAEVGKATHYHAYWVSPWWTREMRKIQVIGVHTFYRPRKWEEEEG